MGTISDVRRDLLDDFENSVFSRQSWPPTSRFMYKSWFRLRCGCIAAAPLAHTSRYACFGCIAVAPLAHEYEKNIASRRAAEQDRSTLVIHNSQASQSAHRNHDALERSAPYIAEPTGLRGVRGAAEATAEQESRRRRRSRGEVGGDGEGGGERMNRRMRRRRRRMSRKRRRKSPGGGGGGTVGAGGGR